MTRKHRAIILGMRPKNKTASYFLTTINVFNDQETPCHYFGDATKKLNSKLFYHKNKRVQ
jgi:hypothetical protein